MQCAKRLGKLVTHSALPSPVMGTLSSQGVLLGTKQCWPGEWDDAHKIKPFFSFLCVVIFSFCVLVCS